MKKQLVNILTASFVSLQREGKFARQLLWKLAKPLVFHEIFKEVQSFLMKFLKIAFVGVFLSFFEESKLIEMIKDNWITALVAFAVFAVSRKLVEVTLFSSIEKSRELIGLHIKTITWQKNQSVGIGTRIGSPFQQKLRTIRRCSYYDIKEVGLWPIEAAASIFSSVVLLGTVVFLSPRIGAIFVVTGIVVAFVTTYMSRWVRDKEKEQDEALDKADEYRPASLSVDSTFLGTSEMLFKRGLELRAGLLREKMIFIRKSMLIVAITSSFTVIAIALQLWFARESLFKDASLVKLGVTVSTIVITVGSFAGMIGILFGNQSSMADVRELQEFIDFPDAEENMDDTPFVMTPSDMVKATGVSFRYPYGEDPQLVIRDINLEFTPGEAVVLVGENGSGKTTFGHVLTNIHRPEKGSVEYGKNVIGSYSVKSVLEHVLSIPQTGDLFDLPLCESLFGSLDMSTIDMSRYEQAILLSGAKEVLSSLPKGIHTQIGTAYEGGTNLSGGQEQRLRLAAFFYKALHPSIKFIIADEPSRYLDPATRQKVYDALVSLARNYRKIVVVISHDAELERFDRAIVFEKGRVVGDYRGDAIASAVTKVSRKLAGDTASS